MSERGAKVLVVEDDARLAEMLVRELGNAGYRADTVAHGGEALFRAEDESFDLILLDLNLPDMDGLEVAEQLRGTTPILMLTARSDVESRIEGLYAGASDYLVKPFSLRELLARVHARVRDRGEPETLELAGVRLDVGSNALVAEDGQRTVLPELECRLLELLLRYRGRVFSRDEIERHLYGADTPGSNTVEVFVHNLRRKLTALGVDDPIATLRNKGYLVR